MGPYAEEAHAVKKIAFVLLAIAVASIAWAVRLFPYQNSGYELYLNVAIGLASAAAVVRVFAKD